MYKIIVTKPAQNDLKKCGFVYFKRTEKQIGSKSTC